MTPFVRTDNDRPWVEKPRALQTGLNRPYIKPVDRRRTRESFPGGQSGGKFVQLEKNVFFALVSLTS